MDEVQVIHEVKRGKNQEILEFISDFDQVYNQPKAAGSTYLNTILAFLLLEAANLAENNEKFVLRSLDFERGNLTDQMKASLKKF